MPSIGKDLQKIRTHLGYTIQDIQHFTKIPVDTLQSIENNSIFKRAQEGTTYIRSFIRSYGRAVRIDDEILIKALDQHSTGNYNNLLLQSFPELSPELSREPENADSEIPPAPGTPGDSQITSEQEHPAKTEKESTAKPPSLFQDENSQSELANKPAENEKPEKPKTEVRSETPADQPSPAKTAGEPSVKSVNWADVGMKAHSEKKQSSVWIVGLIILLVIAALAGYLLYENGYFSSLENNGDEQTTAQYQTTQGGITLDLNSDEPIGEDFPAERADSENADLDDVIYLTIYAAYDRVDPVRVWSDLKPRLDPYWIEHGTALNFDFRDTIRIRGPYSNMLIFKNGHLVEDFQEYFNETENYVELTRDYFISDAKWGTTISFDLPAGVEPPQSVEDRPSF